MTGRFVSEEETNASEKADIMWFNSKKKINKKTMEHMSWLSDWIRKFVKSVLIIQISLKFLTFYLNIGIELVELNYNYFLHLF